MREKHETCPRCGEEWAGQTEYDFQQCGICAYSGTSIPARLPAGRLERIMADVVHRLMTNEDDSG